LSKSSSVTPGEIKLKREKDNPGRETGGLEKDVERDDIEEYRHDQHQRQRDEAVYQQQDAHEELRSHNEWM
jgi:hypothetical protein